MDTYRERGIIGFEFDGEKAENGEYSSIPEIVKESGEWKYKSEKQEWVLKENVMIMKQYDDWVFFEEPGENFNKKYEKVL